MTATATARAKRRKKAKMFLPEEPTIHGEGDKLEIINALNYYARSCSLSDGKRWAIEWCQENYPDLVKDLESTKEINFSNLGYLARMIMNGWQPADSVTQNLEDALVYITKTKNEDKSEDIKTTTEPQQKPIVSKPNPLLETFDEAIDFIVQGIPVDIKKFSLNGVRKKDIVELEQMILYYEEDTSQRFFKFKTGEGNTVITDEPYDTATRRDMIKFLRDLRAHITKVEKRVTRKIVPNTKVDKFKAVRNFSCSRDIPGIDFKGQHPSALIGSREAVVYNIERRHLIIMISSTTEGFSINGKTVYNFDKEKSQLWTIRKPEFLMGLLNEKITSKGLREFAKKLTTKPRSVTSGRFNENMVILAC